MSIAANAPSTTRRSARDPDTLTLEDVGNPGWNPIPFITPEGFAYYLPALARLALQEEPYGYDWFGFWFVWHLLSDGPRNARFNHCSPHQRQAVAAFVKHLIDTRADKLESAGGADEALRAHEIWSGRAAP